MSTQITPRLDQIISELVSVFGLSDVISVLEDDARNRGYNNAADHLKSSRELIDIEDDTN